MKVLLWSTSGWANGKIQEYKRKDKNLNFSSDSTVFVLFLYCTFGSSIVHVLFTVCVWIFYWRNNGFTFLESDIIPVL